jgi:[ribosomal protein S18]-alanine N-acetyltransferase
MSRAPCPSRASTTPPAPLYLRPADTTLPAARSSATPTHRTSAPAAVPAIVPAGASHAELLAELHAAASADAWPASGFLELLAQPNCFALMAEGPLDTRAAPEGLAPDRLAMTAPLGFILYRMGGDECEILTLATLPDARRRGVATALLRAALAASSARGVAAAYLEVAADNGAAQALYRREGFTAVGQRPAYYRNIRGYPAKDAMVLRRPLPGKPDGN